MQPATSATGLLSLSLLNNNQILFTLITSELGYVYRLVVLKTNATTAASKKGQDFEEMGQT